MAQHTLQQSMREFGSQMLWGSPSVMAWRRECELSLERSRARRRHPEVPSVLDYVARALVVVMTMAGLIAFVYSLFFLLAVVQA